MGSVRLSRFLYFFFNDTATTEIYTLSLHDALPISTPGSKPLPQPESTPPRCATISGCRSCALPTCGSARAQKCSPPTAAGGNSTMTPSGQQSPLPSARSDLPTSWPPYSALCMDVQFDI